MKKRLYALPMILGSALLFASCEKDNDNGGEGNEEEVITTMTLKFTPQGGGTAVEYDFDDPDGPGGTAATQDEIVLTPNKTYDVEIVLLNKTTDPDEVITEEVEEEGQAHRFYVVPSAGSGITVSNLNNDTGGMPLGITSTWTTGAAATGTVKVTLRHYPGNPPNKAANDPVDSNKSSTDIEVNFASRVE
ncbi:MAG TPA: hypothetical protein VHK69_22885 [Chitinophagaceae bacterium]|jgi:hypothetical protein|nr:hypothetical protein [Chitinophagaceae bacterium]